MAIEKPLTNGGCLIEVGAREHNSWVHAGPAPKHDPLEAGVAVQALLRLRVRLLIVIVLRLGALRLVDGQVSACTLSGNRVLVSLHYYRSAGRSFGSGCALLEGSLPSSGK